jgi:hypothetical protein
LRSIAQDLKPVADAEHGTAALGERLHLAHDGRETRHCAGAQIVAVREAARQDQHVSALQIRVLVPEILGILAKDIFRRKKRVFVAVAAGEHHHSESHCQSTSTR